jgi:nucleotide-binding universal stress UspA family protein
MGSIVVGMAFKDLLVYLQGSSRSEVTMHVATLIAKRFGARLSGIHVIGLLVPSQVGINLTETNDALTRGAALGRLREAELAATRRAEEIFRKHLDGAKLRGDWQLAEGMVAHTAGTRARRFDMTIVGQVDPRLPPLGTRKFVPEALFLESGRPVLVVPCTGAVQTVGTRVLVAWDGSREASRAVNDALPFLQKAADVSVVTFENSATVDEAIADPMLVVSHLAEHGVRAHGSSHGLNDRSVAEALLAAAADDRCDLLVMGGYGHSRLYEIITGGTTRTILRTMNVPVLLSH